MEKPNLYEFHQAMYAQNPGIGFDAVLEMYLEKYPEFKQEDPAAKTSNKPKKKSKK